MKMNAGVIYEDALKLWQSAGAGNLESAAQRCSASEKGNLLLLGDNLSLMAALSNEINSGAREPFTLSYMDPPYFSNRNPESRLKIKTPSGNTIVKEKAFIDSWTSMDEYLTMLTARIIATRELLADHGSLWIHLDRRAVHYAKVMADVCFGGQGCLINEVVWSYKSGGSSTKRFSNKHDTLLFYAKNKNKYKFFPQEEKSYNRGLKPYRFKGIKEYRDELGWYTTVNMKDVWEIPMVGRTAAERKGYATQKPEALLERIILACTEEGDVCLDPFGGSGTMAAVCARKRRRWVSIDMNPAAVEIAAERLGLR